MIKTQNSQLLEGLTILDFSHRLPGPMAGHCLSLLGAKVLKVEDQKFRDAFIQGLFFEFDPECFGDWYKELNSKKELVQLDFSGPKIKEQIQELLKRSDGLIMGLPPKVRQSLGLGEEELFQWARQNKRPLAVIEMGASLNVQRAMHDLNALSLSGLLELYVAGQEEDILPPPFLPLSGIAFGQKLATDLLGAIIKARDLQQMVTTTTYLLETAQEIFNPFWSQHLRDSNRTKFLHNGAFPCYTLYKNRSGDYVALAAVEEKFWEEFAQTFAVKVPKEKRFAKEDKYFSELAEIFAKLTSEEIRQKVGSKDLCLDIVQRRASL